MKTRGQNRVELRQTDRHVSEAWASVVFRIRTDDRIL